MDQELDMDELFSSRHIGPSEGDVEQMLRALGVTSLEGLIEQTVPSAIRLNRPLKLPAALGEADALEALRAMVAQNTPTRSFIGMGYTETFTPSVILRNILENPAWYTHYTPYQAEIAQGRLEALLNFQTMIADLTGLPVANASLLDEATAAAEAMTMARAARGGEAGSVFFASEGCHPQTLAVLRTRAAPLGIEVVVGDPRRMRLSKPPFAVLVQLPATDGALDDPRAFFEDVKRSGALSIVATDPLALCLMASPGELGADIAVGSAQRFGVPMGFGGPHAAFMATRESLARLMPGRLIGVSQDARGRPALRMALQTREQHIRREKATSNICTSQVLLAVIAGMYAVYHGPVGLRRIATRVAHRTRALAKALEALSVRVRHASTFDTLRLELGEGQVEQVRAACRERRLAFRFFDGGGVGITLDERTTVSELEAIIACFVGEGQAAPELQPILARTAVELPASLQRRTPYLTHPVFNQHHSETEMLRYIRGLELKDLSLADSMIPLGSCTMKLNATSEMLPVTWREVGGLHPFAPAEEARGFEQLFRELKEMLAEITGLPGVSLQPNAGSQGEYAGLLVIRRYHEQRGEAHRDVVLIPQSAHGTNPASAAMAGYRVVVVKTDAQGNIDLADLEARAREHGEKLAALMITYPSTHGVFEETVRHACELIHGHGGQVYLDGANLNAQVGLCRPSELGADVCHLNLHKTFCIPHGGGGPGAGPIAVAAHLTPHLPGHPVVPTSGAQGIGPVSAAPHGSASILVIPWMYVRMMGEPGLRRATSVAILNANYIAERLQPHYPVLYRGAHGRVAHECILDLRPLKRAAGIEVEDVAKRLMDYGFHAPTVSFPVAGTMMVEPTESEPKAELDRFCEAMIAIREEVREIEQGRASREVNLLKGAPHTAEGVCADEWTRPYSRERAAFPMPWVRQRKFWPSVARVNNVLGDRQLICSCPPLETYG